MVVVKMAGASEDILFNRESVVGLATVVMRKESSSGQSASGRKVGEEGGVWQVAREMREVAAVRRGEVWGEGGRDSRERRHCFREATCSGTSLRLGMGGGDCRYFFRMYREVTGIGRVGCETARAAYCVAAAANCDRKKEKLAGEDEMWAEREVSAA
jgi:hypothetical protein